MSFSHGRPPRVWSVLSPQTRAAMVRAAATAAACWLVTGTLVAALFALALGRGALVWLWPGCVAAGLAVWGWRCVRGWRLLAAAYRARLAGEDPAVIEARVRARLHPRA